MDALGAFLFGTKSADRTEGLWLNADIGYMKNWYMSGLLGLSIVIMYYMWLLYMLHKAVPATHADSFVKRFTIILVVMTLMLNFKEGVLAARHLYSLIMILVFLTIVNYLKVSRGGKREVVI